LNLLRQAYVEGHLDPKEAKPFDRKWWLKVRYTLDWLEQKNRNEIRKLKHDLQCGMINYMAGQKAIDLHWDQAHVMQRFIHKSLLPWVKFLGGKMSRRQLKELKAHWEAVWGPMGDKKTLLEINRTVEHLMKIAGQPSRPKDLSRG
jgi:hypothetical protein